MALRIFPPWEQEGAWNLRAPETLGSQRGLLFIDHHRDDMLPVTYPRRPLAWIRRPDGGLEYECELDKGIVMGVRIIPGERSVDIQSFLVNATGAPLENMGTQYCLTHSDVPDFTDLEAERTFILQHGAFIPLGSSKPGPAPGEPPR